VSRVTSFLTGGRCAQSREEDRCLVVSLARNPCTSVHRTAISAEVSRRTTPQDHFPFVGDADAVLAEIEGFLLGSPRSWPRQHRLLTVLAIDLVGSAESLNLTHDAWREWDSWCFPARPTPTATAMAMATGTPRVSGSMWMATVPSTCWRRRRRSVAHATSTMPTVRFCSVRSPISGRRSGTRTTVDGLPTTPTTWSRSNTATTTRAP
jgi:hypothetical protein